MNDPVIDNLFTAAALRPDVSLAVDSRRSDGAGEFDNHLRQAGLPGSAQTAQPWWRSPADRGDYDQGPPDVSGPPPSRPPERAPELATDPSPHTDSAFVEESAPVARVEDARREYDADRNATEAGVTGAAEQLPAKSAPDKQATDNKTTNESPRDANSSADHRATAKSAAAPANKPASPVVAAKDTVAAPQGLPASARQRSVQPADPQAPSEDRPKKLTPADATAKSAQVKAATQQTAQATAITPVAAVAAVSDVATSGLANASVGNSKQSTDSRPRKVAEDRGASAQKQLARSAPQSSKSPAKQSAGVQSTSMETESGDASSEPAAASKAKLATKSEVEQKNATPEEGATAAEHSGQVAQARSNASQSTPTVAAITTAGTTEKATVTNITAEAGTKTAKSSAAPKSATLAAFGRLDRDGASTVGGTQQVGESSDAPRVDPTRFVSRVARAIETAQDRGGPVNLRLSPPELGSLRLELSVKQGVMNARVETDTAAARQTLLDNLPSLRERLAEQNIRVERFDVDVRRDGQGDQASPGTQQRQFQQQQHYYQTPSARPATAPAGSAPDVAEPLPMTRTITDTTINLVA